MADIFRAQIVDVTSHLFTIQVIGTTDKLDAFIEALSEGQVVEVVRTGVTGLAEGTRRCRCRRALLFSSFGRQAQAKAVAAAFLAINYRKPRMVDSRLSAER